MSLWDAHANRNAGLPQLQDRSEAGSQFEVGGRIVGYAGAIASEDWDLPVLDVYAVRSDHSSVEQAQTIDRFLAKWTGFLKGVNPDELKLQYIQEKYA